MTCSTPTTTATTAGPAAGTAVGTAAAGSAAVGTGPSAAGPVVAGTREELRAARDALPGRVAVVMTMGALHAGHARLVREARALADAVVVTIFVNPLQFGQGADLDAYPRTLAADVELLAGLGVDLVFAPDRDVVYPGGDPLVRISAGPLGEVLEGASRPGHFDGVLTVVGKLLHLTRADVAVFGQKDAQQLLLVRRMVADLDLGVDVVGVPTVRDADGLALSSRNARLTPRGRVTALALGRALGAGERVAGAGAGAVLDAAGRVLAEEPGVALDHLALVRPQDLAPVEPDHRGPALLAVAAVVDGTRLIDNVPLVLGWTPGPAVRDPAALRLGVQGPGGPGTGGSGDQDLRGAGSGSRGRASG